jgi:hypothetical protein
VIVYLKETQRRAHERWPLKLAAGIMNTANEVRESEMLYVATFKNTKGRYLVWAEMYAGSDEVFCYSGQRIMDRRQLTKHGNPPDPETGLWLNEQYRVFSASELVSRKPAPKAKR